MGVSRFIVIDPVRDLPAGEHLLKHELAHQGDVLVAAELDRQSDDELLGELRIRAFLERLDPVPEGLDCAGHRAITDEHPRPGWSIGRQQEFLVRKVALVRIVDRPGLGIVLHPRAMPVSG